MRRILVLTLLVPFSAARGADVTYFDRATGKIMTVRNIDLVEGLQGITIKRGGKEVAKVSALDVKDVNYSPEEVKPVAYGDYNQPSGRMRRAAAPTVGAAEKKQLYTSAIREFTELLPQVPAARKLLRRQVQYQAAEALARLAQLEPARRDEALAALAKFKEEHNDGWQLAPTLMLLAQLQEEKGDVTAVQKTYEELASAPGISDDIRTTSLLRVVQTLMKAEKYAAAETKLENLQKTLPADSPERPRLRIYLAQCQILGNDATKAEQGEKQLRELAGSGDASLKALIHNTLGDYLLKKNKPEAAFWEFLRVDVLYNSNPNEHAHALYHLAKLFREVRKDGPRADACLEQLKDKRFEGTEYQKKATEK
jgi:hypothetical protein